MSSAIEQVKPDIDARRQSLVVEAGSGPHWVHGDKTRLTQSIVNLLSNASKFTHRDGVIRVSLSSEARWAKIDVADNGSGIDESLLPYVFDLFSQGERTPDRAQGGLGIGLTIVRNLIALHAGSVHAASLGLGKGSTFSICLPLSAVPALPADARATPLPTRRTARQVLIVDDNLDAADLLAEVLRQNGHCAVVRETSQQALVAAESGAFDTFILDIGLPGINGFELSRRLRANPKNVDALIIALTGYGQAEDRMRSRAAGFDHHFVKPADFTQLAQALSQRA